MVVGPVRLGLGAGGRCADRRARATGRSEGIRIGVYRGAEAREAGIGAAEEGRRYPRRRGPPRRGF